MVWDAVRNEEEGCQGGLEVKLVLCLEGWEFECLFTVRFAPTEISASGIKSCWPTCTKCSLNYSTHL